VTHREIKVAVSTDELLRIDKAVTRIGAASRSKVIRSNVYQDTSIAVCKDGKAVDL